MSKAFPRRIAVVRLALGAAALTLIAGCGGDNYETEDVPNSIVVADLTGNGYLDVAAATAQIDETGLTQKNGYVGVIMNSTSNPSANPSTSSTFSTSVSYTTTSVPPSGIAIGDVMGKGTGEKDIVVANNANGTVSLLTETSPNSGTYNAAKSITTGGEPNQIILADMNGDGALDIVIADGAGYLKILLQDPNNRGSFGSPITVALPADNGVTNQGVSVAVADLNGDGLPDVVITSNQGQDSVNGAGTNGYVQYFQQTGSSSTSVSFAAPVTLAASIAPSCEPSQVRIFDLTGGTTTWAKTEQATMVTAEDTNTMIPVGANIPTGSSSGNPLSILVACQGLIDAVTEEYDNPGVLVINQTTSTNTATFNGGVIYANDNSSTYGGGLSLAVGDIDGDGLPDVVLSSLYPQGEGSIYLMPQDPTTPGALVIGAAYTGLGQPVRIQLADVNNDGYLDIVLADTDTAGVMLNQTGISGTTAGTFSTEYQIGY